MNTKSKIAVLMGGIGQERDISLQSGKSVADALKRADFEVTAIDITPEDLSAMDEPFDCFFIALHGKFGEDGQLQNILEEKNLKYTGSGPVASDLAFDKWKSKIALNAAGIETPSALLYQPGLMIDSVTQELGTGKLVVKPTRQGSSVGISITDSPQQALQIARDTSAKFGPTIIEKFISGRELTVGVVAGQALPIIEIRPKASFYDFNAKYIDNKTEFLFDTITDSELEERISQTALNCFNALNCRHMARVDFILNTSGLYALEVNTIPGFTSHSLLPMAAKKAGLDMGQLCKLIIQDAE